MADAPPSASLGAAFAALLITTAAQAAPDCLALRSQRDQLATQAMQAEIALLQELRQRLCPGEETRQPLNVGAYIHCREAAELQLQRTRPILYRNRKGFTF